MLKNACVVIFTKGYKRTLIFETKRDRGVSESQSLQIWDLRILNTCNINIIYDIKKCEVRVLSSFSMQKSPFHGHT